MNTFTLFDIQSLKNAYESSSIAHDYLKNFLNNFKFESVFETEDESVVFAAGGENDISIEIFDFENAIKRTMGIMYWENGAPVIIDF